MSQTEEMDIAPSPTKERSKGIQAIDKEAVHRICSGQVVLNLATAVKELVENSLDAGATSIEIRLREYGSELVEVVDNGCGVEEANFRGLTLKHHTSKLREFSDLLGVETFGFRGEALSSLCALSDMTVTTRHESSSTATKLCYDSHGHIISKTACARQVGTTVSLADIFSPLPVRQKEFLRNLKREFVKMSQLLHAYCLISTGVKILCSNQTKKGGKTVIVSTQGSSTFKGNIMCIFGAKQAGSLLDIQMEAPSAHHLEDIGLSSETRAINKFELEGCISSCAHGQGRSSTDRQYYFINNRPCDPSKVSKVVNEVYHQFNLHQYPFVFLNVKTARDSVDVNVTPDKRQIFLDNEKLLIATVKASLLKLYEKIPNTYNLQNVSIGSCRTTQDSTTSHHPSTGSPSSSVTKKSNNLSSLLKNFSHSTRKTENGQNPPPSPRDYSKLKAGRGVKRTLDCTSYDRDGKKQLCLSNFVSKSAISSVSHLEEVSTEADSQETIPDINERNSLSVSFTEEQEKSDLKNSSFDLFSQNSVKESVETLDEDSALPKLTGGVSDDAVFSNELESRQDIDSSKKTLPCSKMESDSDISSTPEEIVIGSATECNANVNSDTDIGSASVLLDHQRSRSVRRKTVTLHVNMDKLRLKLQPGTTAKSIKESDTVASTDGKPLIRFYAEIDPSKNKNAELELKKEISKDMFCKMKIIGQFNLGFIITKLGHDLFIVDQHATDEKYNFEMLQSQTSLKNQKLVIPQALELTAVNESILMDNLDIFLKNGFDFLIDKDSEPTRRIRLAAKPMSHNWEFGKEDIDELLFMLQDSPNTMCRPSRVRAMFASRACRKSVMIGTALSKSTMRQLIDHMGEIEQPWNCPHGRPTMRHLINLELVRKQK